MKEESGPIGQLGLFDETHIIGAGISGLLMGYYLKKNGHSVKIFEKQSHIGGKIRTIKGDLGFAETAANAVFTNEDAIDLFQELKISPVKSTVKLKRLLQRTSTLKSFPFLVWEIPFIILSLFKRLPKDMDKISIYEFFKPLLGKRASYEVLSSVFGGIYATDAKTLSFRSVFKQKFNSVTYFGFIRELIKQRKARRHKPESVSFSGGMSDLIQALREKLKDNIVCDTNASIQSNVNTIICTDAHDASKVVGELLPKISEELLKISYSPVISTTMILKTPVSKLEGAFGALFSPVSPVKCAGILNNSAIFPERTVDPNKRSYTFIHLGESYSEQDAFQDLKKIEPSTDWQKSLEEKFVTNWQRGIPLYDQQRSESIKKIRSLFHGRPKGIVLFGNYVDGISIREMISMAKEFASKSPKVISS
ncbi:MAG: hypothetical protein CME64_04990 [Halobacteriovoraceae bacterium]|nr:hypothetical protein [Halobacteriovoraceae bacterium]|tara:strand:- start:340774 stop:342039 length:1266 start_codon:yes stop_codon:yes gene_type:complete